MHDLIHINEALSGLPIDVTFIDFDDLKNMDLSDINVIINAGSAGTAWCGAGDWNDPVVEEVLTEWVNEGGCFIGVNEPSSTGEKDFSFKMSGVLGVNRDSDFKSCMGRWAFIDEDLYHILPAGSSIPLKGRVHLTDGNAKVLRSKDGYPLLTVNHFGRGLGVYLSTFENAPENYRLLLNILMFGSHLTKNIRYIPDNPMVECSYFPASGKLVVINNSEDEQSAVIETDNGPFNVSGLAPLSTEIFEI